MADAEVGGVVWVVFVCHYPFVDADCAAGFEDAEELGVDVLKRGSMACCFDSIDGVKGVFGEAEMLGKVRRLFDGCL